MSLRFLQVTILSTRLTLGLHADGQAELFVWNTQQIDLERRQTAAFGGPAGTNARSFALQDALGHQSDNAIIVRPLSNRFNSGAVNSIHGSASTVTFGVNLHVCYDIDFINLKDYSKRG